MTTIRGGSLRASAPFDDPALGSEAVTVNPQGPATLEMRDDRHGFLADSGVARPIPVVLLPPDPAAPHGAPGTRRVEVLVDGWSIVVELEPARRAELREQARRAAAETGHGGPLEVRAIIPGRILSVAVAPGDTVSAGQQLLVVEAMKMQNELRAPRGGVIERMAVAPGQTVELGDLLVVVG
jgi:biotin carboxyl carrier protein